MTMNDELKELAAAAALARKMDELPADQQAVLGELLGKVAEASEQRRAANRKAPDRAATEDEIELPSEQTQR